MTMTSLINMPLLKEHLKRFWAIGAVLMLFYILAGLLPLWERMGSGHSPHHTARMLVELLVLSHPVPIIVMVAAPFCIAMALHPFCFNSSAATSFYSFPISKAQLFWTNFAAALVLMLLPLLVFSLFLLIPVHYHGDAAWLDASGAMQTWRTHTTFPEALFARGVVGGDVINTVPVVAGFFGRVALGSVFYFSLFLLAVYVSGNRVVSVLLCGALPLVPVGLHVLINSIGSLYVFGFETRHTNTRLMNTLTYSNPALMGNAIGNMRFIIPLFNLIAVYILAAAVLLFAAYVCCHRRRQERTGDSVVFVWLKNVLVFVLSLAGAMFMALFINGFIGGIVSIYFGFVLGFVLAYFIAQMIAEKAFDVRHKVRALVPFSLVMAALFGGMLFITQVLMLPYVNRVPRLDEVASVSLHRPWVWHRPQSDFTISDPLIIAEVQDVHREILDNRRYLQGVMWQRMTDGRWRDTRFLPIEYQLADGSVIQRSYWVSASFAAASGFDALMGSPAVILSEHPVLAETDAIRSIRVNFWDNTARGDDMLLLVESPSDIASLMEAIRADVVENSLMIQHDQMMHSNHSVSIEFSTMTAEMHTRSDHIHLSFYLENIMAWLAERGHLE